MWPFLVDANERARAKNTTAYVRAVGIGLGVWYVVALMMMMMMKMMMMMMTMTRSRCRSGVFPMKFRALFLQKFSHECIGREEIFPTVYICVSTGRLMAES